jgi:putative ATP-dependent endonuclease of OLD family
LDGRFPLSDPLAVVLGANNAGKSNIIDACRALFAPEVSPKARLWLGVDDFTHDGTGRRVNDELQLEAELHGLDAAAQGRLVTCLSPSLGAGTARLRLRARVNSAGKVDTDWIGGDSEHAEVERWAREAVTFTYLPPLRDAAADLRPGRDNRLAHLLDALAPAQHADRSAIEKIVSQANIDLAKIGVISDAQSRIHTRFTAMTGAGALSQRSALAFADPEFSRIVATLRALAGQMHPLELAENGLGYNNLIYMAVLLSALAHTSDDSSLRLLLVEEPEAHLHPQLQDLLMRFLEQESRPAAQVIMTSHSPNFAAAAQVERVTVLTRTDTESRTVGRQPATFGLPPRELAHLRRFLDVTKSALLFARGVILVEGIAEQLLLPAIAQQLDRSLAVHGVTVVNVGGVAFNPFVGLFGPERLPYRCAVVTDADPDDTVEDLDDEESEERVAPSDPNEDDEPDIAMSSRAARLSERVGSAGANLRICIAAQTLEWDLVVAGNWPLLLDALAPLRPRVATRLRRTMTDATNEERANALVKAVKKIKGEFAQSLVDLMTAPIASTVTARRLEPPPHLRQAIEHVTSPPLDPTPAADEPSAAVDATAVAGNR